MHPGMPKHPIGGELANVFTKPLSDSTLDKMTLLLHFKAFKNQGWVSQYDWTVKYETIEDRVRAKATGRADMHVPADPPLGLPTPEDHPIEPENDSDNQRKHPDLPEDVPNLSDGGPPVDNGGREKASVSPEEIRVAHTIKAAYYRPTGRKKEVLKGIDATNARLWSLLRDRASRVIDHSWDGRGTESMSC